MVVSIPKTPLLLEGCSPLITGEVRGGGCPPGGVVGKLKLSTLHPQLSTQIKFSIFNLLNEQPIFYFPPVAHVGLRWKPRLSRPALPSQSRRLRAGPTTLQHPRRHPRSGRRAMSRLTARFHSHSLRQRP